LGVGFDYKSRDHDRTSNHSSHTDTSQTKIKSLCKSRYLVEPRADIRIPTDLLQATPLFIKHSAETAGYLTSSNTKAENSSYIESFFKT